MYFERAVLPRSALWPGRRPAAPANFFCVICLLMSAAAQEEEPDAALCPPAAPARVVICCPCCCARSPWLSVTLPQSSSPSRPSPAGAAPVGRGSLDGSPSACGVLGHEPGGTRPRPPGGPHCCTCAMDSASATRPLETTRAYEGRRLRKERTPSAANWASRAA